MPSSRLSYARGAARSSCGNATRRKRHEDVQRSPKGRTWKPWMTVTLPSKTLNYLIDRGSVVAHPRWRVLQARRRRPTENMCEDVCPLTWTSAGAERIHGHNPHAAEGRVSGDMQEDDTVAMFYLGIYSGHLCLMDYELSADMIIGYLSRSTSV